MNDDCCYKLYMHVNKTNDKVYIGQTKKSYLSRWDNGKGYRGCSRFANAIKKYGWHEGFEHISLIEGLSKSEADYFERFFIEFFDSQNPEFGYNLTAGGDECPMDNPVVREHYDEAMKKLRGDPEYQKKHREAMKKWRADSEWKKNHREAMKKYHADPEWLRKHRETHCKKVRCVETHVVYGSLKEATVAVNLKCSTSICWCCRGKRKTAGGYHWEYA